MFLSFLGPLYRNVGSVLINVETELAGKAAKNHANSDRSIIGGGTSDMYGHVKLTDSYTSNAGSASSGVAASSQALYNAYTALNKEVTESMGALCIDNITNTSTSVNLYPWYSKTALPYEFSYGCAVVYGNAIHVLGSKSSQTKHYKWNGSSWSSVSTLPYYFLNGCAVVYKNEIHILGTSYNSSYYTKHYKWNGSSWSSVSTLPYYFLNGCAVVYKNEIHILGTSYNSSYYTKHYKWNGSSWSSVSTLPYGLSGGAAVVYNNEIHILGSGYNNNYTNHYRWNGSNWSKVSTLPYNFYEGSAVVYGDYIHILGSDDDSTKHYRSKFDLAVTTPYLGTLPFGASTNYYKNSIYFKSGQSIYCADGITLICGTSNATKVSNNEIQFTKDGSYTIYTSVELPQTIR